MWPLLGAAAGVAIGIAVRYTWMVVRWRRAGRLGPAPRISEIYANTREGKAQRSAVTRAGVVAAVLMVLVGVLFVGGGAALIRAAHTSRVEHRTVMFVWHFRTLEDHPYGVVLDNGDLYRFRDSTGLREYRPIEIRFDGLGRILGTTREGIYHPKLAAPSKIVPTSLGLVLIVVGAFLAARNLQIARGRRARAPLWVRRVVYALAGVVTIGIAVRAAVGSITEHVAAFTVEAATAGLSISDGYGWVVLVEEGQSFRYNFPTGLRPGDVLLSRTDGLGHRLSSSFQGRVVPVRPQPDSLVPGALIIGPLGVICLVYAIRSRERLALPSPPEPSL